MNTSTIKTEEQPQEPSEGLSNGRTHMGELLQRVIALLLVLLLFSFIGILATMTPMTSYAIAPGQTAIPSPTLTSMPTNTPVPTPTDTPVPTSTPTNTPVPTPTNTPVPTPTPTTAATPLPKLTATPRPSAEATPTIAATPTRAASFSGTATPISSRPPGTPGSKKSTITQTAISVSSTPDSMTTSFDVTSSKQEGIQNNGGTLVTVGTLVGISAFTLLAALLIGSAQRTRRRRRASQRQVVQETTQTADAPGMDRSEIELVFGRHNRHAWEMSEKPIATRDLKSVSMQQSKPTFWEDMKADPVLEAMMRQAQSGLFVLPGREQ